VLLYSFLNLFNFLNFHLILFIVFTETPPSESNHLSARHSQHGLNSSATSGNKANFDHQSSQQSSTISNQIEERQSPSYHLQDLSTSIHNFISSGCSQQNWSSAYPVQPYFQPQFGQIPPPTFPTPTGQTLAGHGFETQFGAEDSIYPRRSTTQAKSHSLHSANLQSQGLDKDSFNSFIEEHRRK
jgi:hypothetical protein